MCSVHSYFRFNPCKNKQFLELLGRKSQIGTILLPLTGFKTLSGVETQWIEKPNINKALFPNQR
jgi:hypothetical protein